MNSGSTEQYKENEATIEDLKSAILLADEESLAGDIRNYLAHYLRLKWLGERPSIDASLESIRTSLDVKLNLIWTLDKVIELIQKRITETRAITRSILDNDKTLIRDSETHQEILDLYSGKGIETDQKLLEIFTNFRNSLNQ